MSSSADTDGPPDRVTLPAASFSLGPGDVLGRKYRIEALIAQGGMGVVLRATHLDLACQVAIKVIRPECAANEDLASRLLAEARILASLRSKHVNRVLDVGRTEAGMPYLVLEYMEGTDLGNYLERCGKLPVGEAVAHVLSACEALAEAHAIGVVHRDLKPENLFLSDDAEGGFVLKVFDFGISKAPATPGIARTVTDPGGLIGSPCYMSPEQVSGAAVDGRSDIWALGTVLFELCSGQLLFEAQSTTATFSLILAPDRVLPTLEVGSSSEHLRRVLSKCLQLAPDARYQSVVELALDLVPLGADPLQAARVVKVAAAARARVIGRRGDDSPVGSPTPFALSASQLDAELAPQASLRRSRWLAPAIALAGVAALVSVYFIEARGRRNQAFWPPLAAPAAPAAPTASAAPTALARASERPVPPPPASEAVEATAETRIAAAATEPKAPAIPAPFKAPLPLRSRPAVAPLAVVPRAVVQPDVAPPVVGQPAVAPPVVVQPAVAPSVVAPPAVAPSGDPSKVVAIDAWDPKLFGGRR